MGAVPELPEPSEAYLEKARAALGELSEVTAAVRNVARALEAEHAPSQAGWSYKALLPEYRFYCKGLDVYQQLDHAHISDPLYVRATSADKAARICEALNKP